MFNLINRLGPPGERPVKWEETAVFGETLVSFGRCAQSSLLKSTA